MSSEDARRRRLAWVAVAAQAVAIVGLLLGPGPWFSGPRWLTVLGVVLLLAGAGIALGGMTGLGRALTPTPVPVEGAGLRTGGLYRFVRHPIYAGVLLGAGGVVLCGPSPWRVAWWLVLLAVLLPKSAWEERMLAAEYADYPDYARRTGRFFPRIRKR